MQRSKFIKGVESLINPIEVASLQFFQQFSGLMPKKLQNYFVTNSAKQTPYMGFVVEPYSLFLCYEIKDLKHAKKLLPNGFELTKIKIFDNDEPKYYCIFGCFRVHTSAFWGMRNEFYVIAKDTSTGIPSWIIIDYDSDTMSYDRKNGLKQPNSSKSIMTIDYTGTIILDVPRNDKSRRLSLECNIENGEYRKLDQDLWLAGNLSIGYGKILSEDSADIFSLKFQPKEVEKALNIPQKDLKLEENSWFPGLFEEKPSQVVCFPYAQHFVSDSPGNSSRLLNKNEMVKAIEAIDFGKIKVLSSNSIKRMFIIGSVVTNTLTILTTYLLARRKKRKG